MTGYDSLSTADAAEAAEAFRSPHDINLVIRYEETHKTVERHPPRSPLRGGPEAVGVDA